MIARDRLLSLEVSGMLLFLWPQALALAHLFEARARLCGHWRKPTPSRPGRAEGLRGPL